MVTTDTLETRRTRLEHGLKRAGSLLVALSGGADSAVLAAEATRVLGPDKVVAATARGPIFPRREMERARQIADMLGIEHVILDVDVHRSEAFRRNPPDRCYECKKVIFGRLLEIAKERGLAAVADGTNIDDLDDYRPGLKATEELGVRQPLREAGLRKADLRVLAARLGLPEPDFPSAACLASRFPYGEPITPEGLKRIERSEEMLREAGYRQVRVRCHGPMARIELGHGEDASALLPGGSCDTLPGRIKELGFHYVALDLEGYRTGSLNEALGKPGDKQ